ncbi:MAG: transposase [Bdellovibrio sp.]
MGRKIFLNDPDFPYHVTARCINHDWFSLDMHLVWEIMTRHLYFTHLAFDVRVHAFLLMGNHYHLIIRAPKQNLSAAMQYFMRESSRDLTRLSSRINQTYGSRFHRSLLNSPLYYLHAYKYLYRNPVSARVCKKVEDYPFSTLQALLGNSRVEVPVLDDWNWGSLDVREETLIWLNTAPNKEDLDNVRKALRKGTFEIPKRNIKNSLLEKEPL